MTKQQLSLFDEPKTIVVDQPDSEPTQQDMFSQREIAQFGVTANPRKIITPVAPSLKMSRENANGLSDEQFADKSAQEKQIPLPQTELETVVQLSSQPNIARQLTADLLATYGDENKTAAVNAKIKTHSLSLRRAVASLAFARKNNLLDATIESKLDDFSVHQKIALLAALSVDCKTTNGVVAWIKHQLGEPDPDQCVDANSDDESDNNYTKPVVIVTTTPDLDSFSQDTSPVEYANTNDKETDKPFTVDYRNLHAVITFPFSYPRKDLVKSIPHAQFRKTFEGVEKCWTIPPKHWADMLETLGDQAIFTPEFEAVRDNAAQLDIQQADAEDIAEQGQIYYFRKRVYIAFPYDETTKDKIKAIDGSKFHPTLKQWSVPLAAMEFVVTMFPDFHVDASIEKMKEAAKKAKIQAEKLKAKRLKREQEQRQQVAALIARLQPELQSTLNNPPLPAGWSLFDHQKIGIEFLVKRRNAILADDMGLGKTLMALLAARVYQKTLDAQIIVVCPASVRQNWQKEARMFDTLITDFSWAKQPFVQYQLDDAWHEYGQLDKKQRRRAKQAAWRVKLVGYDAGNIIPHDQPFVLIADEAHYAQSMTSNRSKAFRELAAKATASFLLSGTPAKNGRPINILPLLIAIDHPVARNKSQFKKKFCSPRSTQWGMDYNGVANLGELYTALRSTHTLLRRTKEDCLDLPEKTRIFKAVSLSAQAEKVYKERFAQKKAEYHQRVKAGKITTAAEAIVMLNFLHQAASAGKTEHALELVLEVMQQGKPVIVFTEFKDTITTLQQAVEKAGFPVDVIQGSTKGDDRQIIAEKYQTDTPRPRCFIGTKAAQEGLTLTDADTVILIDRPWTPGDAIQREDRTWRIGQRNCVTAYWLQYGVDADIDGLILEKQANANQILTGERTTLKGTRAGSIAVQALKAVFED